MDIQSLAERFLFLWDDSPELKVLDLSLNRVLRRIMCTPATENPEYLGEFQRITKPAKQLICPIMHGSLGNTVYLSIIRGTAKMHNSGIKALRRAIDHMVAFNHTPSQDVIQAVATECVEGLWPKTGLAFARYLLEKQILVTTDAMAEFVALLRRTAGHFDDSLALVKETVKLGSLHNLWTVMESPILKYLKHRKVEEAVQLVEECCKIISERKISEDPTEQDSKIRQLRLSLHTHMVKALLEHKYYKEALAQYTSWLANFKTKEVLTLGLQVHEKIEEVQVAIKYLEQAQKCKEFEVDRNTLISILKIAKNAQSQGVAIADKHVVYLFNLKTYSPFAFNLFLMIYGANNVKKVADLCAKINNQEFKVNYYTYVTLSKILRNIPEGEDREKLISEFKRMDFPDPTQPSTD